MSVTKISLQLFSVPTLVCWWKTDDILFLIIPPIINIFSACEIINVFLHFQQFFIPSCIWDFSYQMIVGHIVFDLHLSGILFLSTAFGLVQLPDFMHAFGPVSPKGPRQGTWYLTYFISSVLFTFYAPDYDQRHHVFGLLVCMAVYLHPC